ncbi:MAG TPA: ABC transporter ATP-binding protein [Acidimicrobiia bacterium]|nr:ABC transporter ATP-binding protein [Acidimicrobiia bacterium]
MTAAPELTTGRALLRALRLAPVFRRGLGVTVALVVLGTAMQIVVPVVVQQIFDSEILAAGGVDVGGVALRGLLGVSGILVAAVAGRTAQLRLARASAHGLSDLRVLTFRHLHRLSMLHVQGERRGALVSRVTSDVATIQDFMDFGGLMMLVGSAQVSLAVIVMAWYRWQLALLVVGGVVVYAVLLSWFQRILSRAHDRVRERVADSLSALSEAITGLPAVRAHGAEETTLRRLRDALDRQFATEFRTGRLGAVLFSSAELFAGAITASVIAVGVWLGAGAGVTAGTLLAFLFLVNLLVGPIQMLVETLDSAQTAGAGVRRILRVLDTPVDVADPVDGLDLPPGGLDVAVTGLRYRYPGADSDVLDGVAATIPAGTRVAIVGETGSGKTTFAKLVTRLLDPDDGVIEIGGVPVDLVAFSSLRERVAYVPQEGFLFDVSIADNVRYGRPGAGDAEVAAAFGDLGLSDWVASLPSGLATPVGERGGQLSAGERQLVALVRAWIADPDLLVLDEATSAVDPALEVSLRRAIERLTEGRTSLTVAHRLSTAEASDEVLVFDGGRLVERGPHATLMSLGGVYAGLYADWTAGTGAE